MKIGYNHKRVEKRSSKRKKEKKKRKPSKIIELKLAVVIILMTSPSKLITACGNLTSLFFLLRLDNFIFISSDAL